MKSYYTRSLVFILLAVVATFLYVDTWQNNPDFFIREVRGAFRNQSGNGGTVLSVGVSARVSVDVVRRYYGLFELPVYVGGVSLDGLHQSFFFAMLLLVFVPVLLEVREWKSRKRSSASPLQAG